MKAKETENCFFAHPHAIVEAADIGLGTRIWAFAHVMEGARIGSNCNICDHVFVESNAQIGNGVTVKNGVSIWDGVILEDNVFIGPNAVFTNDKNPRAEVKKSKEQFMVTRVRRGASIGANATLVCGIDVGRYAFVGAGTVVTKSVPDYAVVVGNPARQIGHMCECGLMLDKSISCPCGRAYEVSSSGLARKSD